MAAVDQVPAAAVDQVSAAAVDQVSAAAFYRSVRQGTDTEIRRQLLRGRIVHDEQAFGPDTAEGRAGREKGGPRIGEPSEGIGQQQDQGQVAARRVTQEAHPRPGPAGSMIAPFDARDQVRGVEAGLQPAQAVPFGRPVQSFADPAVEGAGPPVAGQVGAAGGDSGLFLHAPQVRSSPHVEGQGEEDDGDAESLGEAAGPGQHPGVAALVQPVEDDQDLARAGRGKIDRLHHEVVETAVLFDVPVLRQQQAGPAGFETGAAQPEASVVDGIAALPVQPVQLIGLVYVSRHQGRSPRGLSGTPKTRNASDPVCASDSGCASDPGCAPGPV